LAGTTLAWHLAEAGQRVLLLDPHEPVTTSRIAAGLMTPITGRRLVASWRCDEFLPAARAFYRRIEQRTGARFFHDRTAIRLFAHDDERSRWAQLSAEPSVTRHLVSPQPVPLLDPELADTSGGGFEMTSAQLDVAAYLDASRAHLDCRQATLDWRRDVTLTPDGATVLEHRARRVISCEGFAATRNPYFSQVRMRAAKGDILTVRFDAPLPPKTIHRGIWIAPTPEPGVHKVGATYEWDTLDQVPSAAGRAEIETKLRAFMRVPYTVLAHAAAVRPIIRQSKPLMGLHPAHAALGYFNGLGSKGSLHAPWFAAVFAGHLVDATPLPDDLDLRKAL
jgi:glycine oxidase